MMLLLLVSRQYYVKFVFCWFVALVMASLRLHGLSRIERLVSLHVCKILVVCIKIMTFQCLYVMTVDSFGVLVK